MTKKFFNCLAILLFALSCLSINAGAQTITAEAKLQQYSIRIGDQTKLFLSVHQPVKEHVNFPTLTDTIIAKVQVVGTLKPDTLFDKNDHNQATITHSYIITSFDAGTYTLPMFSFGTSGGVLKSMPLTLQVQTVKVDTTKAIYDIKQPMAVSYTIFDWLRDNWVLVAIVVAITLLIVFVVRYLKNRPKDTPIITIAKPVIPVHTIALNKLQELRSKKLWQQDVKLYHSELSDILREYLEKRYAIKTYEKTTDEIFVSLRHMSISNDNRNKLRQILVLADLVKFAKERPLPNENEQSIEIAMDFVSATQPVAKVAAAEGGEANG